MNSPLITVQNHRYPFAHSAHPQTKVVQTQYFKTLDQLQQKKKELTKKSQLINNQSIIKLQGINQRGMALIYNYEFIPHSFESYLRSKWEEQPPEIWSMTKKLFTKKVTFQLTLLTIYLGKMKIQTELGVHNLGISKDEKLKLYVSPKSKMGIKPEIQLIIIYNQNKQKILKELQQLFTQIESNTLPSNQASSNAKNFYQNLSDNQSQIFYSSDLKSQYRQSSNFSSKIPLNPTPSFLMQTRIFKDSTSQFRPRKMSTGNLQLNKGVNIFKNTQKLQESKTPKAHKYSFQFGTPSQQYSSFNQGSFVEKQEEPKDSYSEAKSIKIQLQQKKNLDSKKQRKDSYKVKITTVRQYDLGENLSNIFGGAPNNEDDIFQYFAKRSKEKPEDEMSQDPQKYQDKCRKQTFDTNLTNQEVPEPSSPFSHISTKERKHSQNSTSRNIQLEQKIRQAKQRTSKALNLMKNLKK